MFYKLFIRAFLLCGVCYIQFAFSSSLSQLRQERENKYQEFIKSANNIKQCNKELRGLEGQINAVHKNILSKQSDCGKIDRGDKYKECVSFVSQSIVSLKDLKNVVLDTQKKCPLFDSESLIDRLSKLINFIEPELITLNGRHEFIAMDDIASVNVYNKNKLLKCSISLRHLSEGVSFWIDNVNWSLIGPSKDLYPVLQSFSALRIYEDYFLTTKEICLTTTDPEKTKDYDKYIKRIETRDKELKEEINTFFNRYSVFPFEENAAIICNTLGNSDAVTKDVEKDLCEEPLNNPSWIYSAHYLLKNNL